MSFFFIKTVALLLYLFICPPLVAPSHAYVLSGSHLLRLMTRDIGQGQGLIIDQKHIVYDARLPNESVELSETLRYLFPDKFRSDLRSEKTHRIHVLSNGTGLTVIDGKVAADDSNIYDRYMDVLLHREVRLLENRLAVLGVDVKRSSLGRFKGRIGFVVGSEYPDDSIPQLWLDKETFRPFRWIVLGRKSNGSGIEFEIRYHNWQKTEEIWYPMEIAVYENDVLTRMLKVKTIKARSNFASGIFSKQKLRSESQAAVSNGPEKESTEAEDEVKKTIEEFKKLYE